MAELNNTGDEIIIATNKDEAGNRLVDTLASLAPHGTSVKRHIPELAQDWNECLQRQQYLNQFSSQQSRQKPKQKKQSQLEL